MQKAENDVSCHKNGRRRYEGKISLYCVDDMSGITASMGTNQEIVGDLKKQMDIFANL